MGRAVLRRTVVLLLLVPLFFVFGGCYEVWEEDVSLAAPVKWTVTFNLNYVGSTPIPPLLVDNGALIPQNIRPTRSGYTFDYWELDSRPFNFDTAVTSNITLIAHWKQP